MTTTNRSVRTFAGLASGALALAIGAGVLTAWTLATPQATASHVQPEDKLIATVDIIYLIESGLAGDGLTEERAALNNRILARASEFETLLVGIQQRASTMDPNDPAFQELYNQYNQTGREFEQFNTDAYARQQALTAQQATTLYEEIRNAIDAVADREGYRYVLSSKSDRTLGDDLVSVGVVTQQVLSRSLVHGGQNHDLTERVRTELGYPVPTPAEDAEVSDADSGDADSADTATPEPSAQPDAAPTP